MDSRWWVLCCCGILSYVTDFYGDEPSVLVQRLTGTAEACNNGTDRCVQFSVQQFNMLFSSSAWAAAFASVLIGFWIDRYGCKTALWITGGSLVLGSLLFVGATYMSSTRTSYVLAIIGRVLYGHGNGSSDVITHRLKSSWFFYTELALAFAIHIMCGRFGDATVFFGIGFLLDLIGLQACLWIGFAFTVIAAVAAVVLSFIEEQSSAMVDNVDLNMELHVIVRFAKSLDAVVVCFIFIVFLYYGTIAVYTGNGPNFTASAMGYSEATASYVIGLVYLISPLQLLFGHLTDRYGLREYWLLVSSLLLVLFFACQLGIDDFPPWLLAIGIGIGFNIFSPTVWSSVSLIVQPKFLGTAMGCLKFFHFSGTGTLMAIAGAVLDTGDVGTVPWHRMFVLVFGASSLCFLISVGMVVCNAKTGYRMTPSQRKRDDDNTALMEATSLMEAASVKGQGGVVSYGIRNEP